MILTQIVTVVLIDMSYRKLYSKEILSGNFKYVYEPHILYYTDRVGFGSDKEEAYEDFVRNNRTIYFNTSLPESGTDVFYKDYYTKLEDVEIIYVKGFYWKTDMKGKLVNVI